MFQQEIRRFMLMLGTRYMSRRFSIQNIFSIQTQEAPKVRYKAILKAVVNMSKNHTGALIVIAENQHFSFLLRRVKLLMPILHKR